MSTVSHSPRIYIPSPPATLSVFVLGGLFTAAGVILLSQFGVNWRVPRLADVYGARLEFTSAAQAKGRVVSYFVLWTANVVNPALFAVGLLKRSTVLLVLGIAGQWYLYSLAAYKTVLVSLIGIALLLFLAKRKRSRAELVSVGMLSIATAGLFVTAVATMLVRRIAMTGVISTWYLQFFSTHEKARLGNSLLGWLTTYPYDRGIANIIGVIYLDNTEAHANGNFWADGFANFGFIGLVMWSLALAMVLWLIDCVAYRRDHFLSLAVLLMPAMALANVSLQTALLTHGIALGVLVVWMLPTLDNGRRMPSEEVVRD
ncbi:MAG: hypothetical protein ACYC7A_05915 [Thermoanaerobaculia bacterium]